MNINTLQVIISEYFSEYPITTNLNAILLKANALNLNDPQVAGIIRTLRKNTGFFESRDAVRYGLLNLFIYAVDAMFVPEDEWDTRRYEVTSEYKKLLKIQDFFTINLQ